ncbi:MAG: hypothetical protein WKF41_05740 [Gaiellaceae bacterium]
MREQARADGVFDKAAADAVKETVPLSGASTPSVGDLSEAVAQLRALVAELRSQADA